MCDHESQRIICELSAAMDQLMLNQNEMAARAKQTNEILKAMQKVTEELKEENTRLYHENALLRGDAGFQKEHHPLQGMLRLAPVDDDDESTSEDTEGHDDAEEHDDVEEVFGKSTCWGCQTNQPNQLAHMDPGGCLHFVASDDEDSENEREITGLTTVMDEMEFDD